MYNPLKMKYWDTYMKIAETAALASTSNVAKVGAALVLPSGLISIGWNGTPPGEDNCCEDLTRTKQDEVTGKIRNPTKTSVIHAEINALKKLKDQGISADGGILFVTLSPCANCCNQLVNSGITTVVYKHTYKDHECLMILHKQNISTCTIN